MRCIYIKCSMSDYLDPDALELARGRERAKDYVNLDIPVNVEHKKLLEAQKAKARGKLKANSPRSLCTDDDEDEGEDESSDDDVDDIPSQSITRTKSNQLRPRPQTAASANGLLLPSPSGRQRSRPQKARPAIEEPPLKMNELMAELHFGDKRWTGKAVCDSGCIENWINEQIVTKYDLKAGWKPSLIHWYSFDNSPVRSSGVVDGYWAYQNNTRRCNFQIAPKGSPFDVLIGCKSLMERGWLLFDGKDADMVAPLVEGRKSTKGQFATHDPACHTF